MQRITTWRHERRLSTKRAGTSGREFASERLRAFVRANAVWLVLMLVVSFAFGALVFLMPDRFDSLKGFAFGAWCGVMATTIYHWCVIASGASQSMMGEYGEIWTDQELVPLKKRGWRLVNHLTLKQGDIDHVAIGPGGLMVIESKWTSSPIALDGTDDWVGNWANQARRNTDDVKRFIGWGARRDAPISPLLVIWGPQVKPQDEESHREQDGVTVVAGRQLRRALDANTEQRIDQVEIERVYRKIAGHAEERDRTDLKRNGPRPRSATEVLSELPVLAMASWLSAHLAVATFRLPAWAWAPVEIVIVVAGIVAFRRERSRRVGAAWLLGFGAVVCLMFAFLVKSNLG